MAKQSHRSLFWEGRRVVLESNIGRPLWDYEKLDLVTKPGKFGKGGQLPKCRRTIFFIRALTSSSDAWMVVS